MERLIGKWFLGSDRPISATGTYQYVSGSLIQNGISYTDICQGSAADCYLLASLGAMAVRSPSTLSNLFIDNGDGTLTVRFSNYGTVDYLTVDRYLPTNAAGNAIYAGWGGGSYSNSNNELWVALLEKAYAQLNQSGWIGRNTTNTYAGLDYGYPSVVLGQLTGETTAYHAIYSQTPTTASASITDLINAYSAGRMVALDSKMTGVASAIVADHIYTLLSYTATTDRFLLFNPWGVNGNYDGSQFKPGFVELTRQQLIDNFMGWDQTTA
jgi:hypothetical protein